MKLRLNKFLAEAGIASRRHADDFIIAGKIKINGKIVAELGTQIDPETDLVEIDNEKIQPSNQLIYYALDKPVGVVSTAEDENGRPKVTDLVPAKPRVYPVGRLDLNSRGLIILTNDGSLTQQLTHPSFLHPKKYEVIVKKSANSKVRKEDIKDLFENGLTIDGILMKADQVNVSDSTSKNEFKLDITLHTGYNRQIRKMCAKIGLEVLDLKRTMIAKLKLEDIGLESGEYKQITKKQIL